MNFDRSTRSEFLYSAGICPSKKHGTTKHTLILIDFEKLH